MQWHYTEAGRQHGPFSDEQIAELARDGQVTPETMVWHEGMSDWQPYASVDAPAQEAGGLKLQPRPEAPPHADEDAHSSMLDDPSMREKVFTVGGIGREIPSEKSEATRQLKDLRREMPEVASAYVPSGRLTPQALIVVPLGAILSIPIGLAAGAAVWVLGNLLFQLLAYGFSLLVLACGIVACGVPFLMVIVAGMAILLRYGVVGGVAGKLVGYLGKRTRNRNRQLAGIASFAAAAVAAFLMVPLMSSLDLGIFPKDKLWQELQEHVPMTVSIIITALMGWDGGGALFAVVRWIGIVIAGAAGGASGSSAVEQQKFCEQCDTYMKDEMLDSFGWGHAALYAALHGTGDAYRLPQLKTGSGIGGECEARIFWCPHCDEGYAETTAKYEWEMQDEDGNFPRVTDTWLLSSLKLSPELCRQLRGVD